MGVMALNLIGATRYFQLLITLKAQKLTGIEMATTCLSGSEVVKVMALALIVINVEDCMEI